MGKIMVPSGNRKKLGFTPFLAFTVPAGELITTKSASGPLGISSPLSFRLADALAGELTALDVAVPAEVAEVAVGASLPLLYAVSASMIWFAVSVSYSLFSFGVWRTKPCFGFEIMIDFETAFEEGVEVVFAKSSGLRSRTST